PLGEGEHIVIHWVVAPSLMRRRTDSDLRVDDLRDALRGKRLPSKLSRDEHTKVSDPPFESAGRLGVSARSPARARRLMRRVLSGVYASRGLEARLQPRL